MHQILTYFDPYPVYFNRVKITVKFRQEINFMACGFNDGLWARLFGKKICLMSKYHSHVQVLECKGELAVSVSKRSSQQQQ